MQAKLTRVRLNDLLDDAPSLRRERTAIAVGLALPFNIESTRRVKPFNSHRPSIARAATLNVNRFKLSPAAQHLTPELTGRDTTNQAFNLADDRQADSAPVQ
jgi:hypothetical protein